MKKERNRRLRRKNVGTMDSLIRVSLGALILIAGVLYESWWGAIGLIPLLTGAISWCPIYKLFGIQTCSNDLETEV
ncbi:MAG: YgaP family membrane protein [Bacteroidota bacterium]